MEIKELYAAAVVSEIERSEKFYTALLGRGPDDRPMDGLIQWRGVADQAGLQVVLDPERAGKGNMTIVVPTMSAARSDLSDRGLSLGDNIQGDYGVIAQIRDPDGNSITLAEPPSGLDA
ncbi:MAG: VOC family protein [Acidimicrobiales bacterium]|nr:VOC family protein [Acidimicrobiales bacterium]